MSKEPPTLFGLPVVFDDDATEAEAAEFERELAEMAARPPIEDRCPECDGYRIIVNGSFWHGCLACGGTGRKRGDAAMPESRDPEGAQSLCETEAERLEAINELIQALPSHESLLQWAAENGPPQSWYDDDAYDLL